MDGNHNPDFGNERCSDTEAGNSLWEVCNHITTGADDYWRVMMFSITIANSICASCMFVQNGETTTTTYVL